jgi:hypothetical protein
MALPPRSAAYLVQLSDPDGEFFGQLRPSGHQIFDPIGADFPEWIPPYQKLTFAYQHLFTNYPDEVVVMVHQDSLNALSGIEILLDDFENNVDVDSTYPDPLTIVREYDPSPPPGPAEPAPNPNGGSKNDVFQRNGAFPGGTFRPRWHTDPAYELYNSEQRLGTICPLKDYEYVVDSGGTAFFPSCWSVDLTVTNKDSEVLNEETDELEYYPFEQATFDFKQTAKLKIFKSGDTCCWNEGAVINGEVRFQSVDVTVEALPEVGSEYGFGGMTAKTGFVASDEGSQSFSITIGPSYTPIEITIPATPGKITFVNDFVITSVTKPT